MGRRGWLLVGIVGLLATNLAGCTSNTPYDIAVFGDVPYSTAAAAKYDTMIAAINAGTTSFAVHVGDIGHGSSTCTTATVDTETARFDTFSRALVYTPGDNEWTDCGTSRLTQLAYLRSKVFRGTGTQSRGQAPLTLESQAAAGYPENARWRKGPITFATLHLVGSNDDYADRTEFDPRRAATITWLHDTFTAARANGDKGVVLLAQTDPTFAAPTAAYQSMYDAVKAEALAYTGQILYVNGDGHVFHDDHPLAGATNLHRIEVEGDTLVSYVKVHIDPAATEIFTITGPTRF